MDDSQHVAFRLPDGRNLDVFLSGAADGPVLLFHHGTPSSGLPSPAMAAIASRLGLRLVTTSRAGYGDSSRNPGRSVGDVAADAEALLSFLGADSCLVAGWSGGGPHALACGARLPHRVAAVALIAGVAPYPADGIDWLAGMGQDNIEEFGISRQGEAALRPYLEGQRRQLLEATPEDLITTMSSILSPVDKSAIAGEFGEHVAATNRDAIRVGVDGWLDDDLAFVKPWGFTVAEAGQVPTRLWQGTDDLMVPFAHGQWLAERIPGVVAHFEPGEGHLSLGANHMDQILQDLLDASDGRL